MKEFITGRALYGAFSALINTQSDAVAILVFIGFLALCIIVPYLCGSFNAAIFVSKVFYHDDIRKHGSGNAGTNNMLRTFGWRAALLTLVFDVAKTSVAILFAWLMMGGAWVGFGFSFSIGAYLAMLFCVLGHIYPIYFGFKGGKGILCTATCVGWLSPWLLVILLTIFIVTVVATKYVSIGSLLSSACYPLFLSSLVRALFGGLSLPGELMLIALLVMGLLIYAHRTNIVRLYRHEEHKLKLHRRDEDEPEKSTSGWDEEEE